MDTVKPETVINPDSLASTAGALMQRLLSSVLLADPVDAHITREQLGSLQTLREIVDTASEIAANRSDPEQTDNNQKRVQTLKDKLGSLSLPVIQVSESTKSSTFPSDFQDLRPEAVAHDLSIPRTLSAEGAFMQANKPEAGGVNLTPVLPIKESTQDLAVSNLPEATFFDEKFRQAAISAERRQKLSQLYTDVTNSGLKGYYIHDQNGSLYLFASTDGTAKTADLWQCSKTVKFDYAPILLNLTPPSSGYKQLTNLVDFLQLVDSTPS